ncbi:MAG TPA: energy transducer TonB [Terriglobales bacterium]|nr:energy transducer TonB [Terriglobales bacterium]
MENKVLTPRPDVKDDSFPEPELDLLSVQKTTEKSTWGSLVENFRDTFFPKKLPPLVLTSKPVKVKNIWGDYNYKKKGATGSLIFHVVMIGAVAWLSYAGYKTVRNEQPKQTVTLLTPDTDLYMPITQKPNDTLAGGGGGGDRDKLEAPKGKLPKFEMQPIAPPAMVIRNENPKLPVEPSVAMPPEVKLPVSASLPNLGDPLSRIPSGPPSNGTGAGGGIGSGVGGGVGAGEGPGVGPGRGGGYGGGVFRVGGGVSAPKALATPDPEYSEEARKAKYQGTVILWLIVDQNGSPRDVKIARSLGMGLDQKAIEAVKQWKFEPALKDGRPVAVQINVEVNFRLY